MEIDIFKIKTVTFIINFGSSNTLKMNKCKSKNEASSYVTDFNTRNKLLTEKLLEQGYHKLRKTFSKFYRRYFDLISKFQVGLKSLLRQGLSEPEFYGDLVYKLK